MTRAAPTDELLDVEDRPEGRLRLRVATPLADRFWAKVQKRPGDACWFWVGSLTDAGYGEIWVNELRKTQRAHRVSWRLAHGQIPAGLDVLHRCDVPRCVRPDHLFLGTKFDNMRDMAQKGRAHLQRNPRGLAGERHWTRRHPDLTLKGASQRSAKLTEAQVVEMRERRARGESQHALARAFGVSVTTANEVVRGLKWSHVGGPIQPSSKP